MQLHEIIGQCIICTFFYILIYYILNSTVVNKNYPNSIQILQVEFIKEDVYFLPYCPLYRPDTFQTVVVVMRTVWTCNVPECRIEIVLAWYMLGCTVCKIRQFTLIHVSSHLQEMVEFRTFSLLTKNIQTILKYH